MDGIHDLGGKQGFGHVETNESGPALPEHWQGFVFALVQQLYRLQVSENVDHFRHSVERISPAAYLSDGYYGRWLGAAETMLVEKGLITQQELDQAVAQLGSAHHRPRRRGWQPLPDRLRFLLAPRGRSDSPRSTSTLHGCLRSHPGPGNATHAAGSRV